MLFSNTIVNGTRCDVSVRHGRIHSISEPQGRTPAPQQHIQGGTLTAHFAEPHVHLDAALLGARMPNRSGTLVEGIRNWAVLRDGLTTEDVIHRARQVCEMYAKYGTTTLRTHVDTGSLLAVEALLDVRDWLKTQGSTLEVVAFPQEGIFRTPGAQQQWETAIEMGCDVVGAIPHFERTTEEGWDSVRLAFDLAERFGRKIDMHCDETDDPTRNLEVLCTETLKRSMQGQVVASHCTAMHSYPNPYSAKVIQLVTEAEVIVVTNPLDNIVLQGRYDGYPRRRGHPRIDELWAAGARIAIGHDSVMDPWYRLGTANLMDAAYMLVHYAHLTSEDELRRVVTTLSTDNHLPFGPVPELTVGAPANLLWWPQEDLIDILRLRPIPKVFRA